MMRAVLRSVFVVFALQFIPFAEAADLFWNDEAGIHRWRYTGPLDPSVLFDTFETRGIAIDAVNDRLLWSDVLPIAAPGPGGVIRTGSTQGGTITDVASQLPAPAGVALDARHRRIYWSDLGDANNSSAVFAANLDGSDVRQIISGPSFAEIAGISIDTSRDKVYFTYINPLIDSLLAGGIARADLDGSNVEAIVGGLGKPLGIAVDPEGGGMYWADARTISPAGGEGTIQAADLNGLHQRTLLGGLNVPYGVALNLTERNVYWADMGSGKIQRTGMSGSLPFFQDVVTGLTAPTAIALFVPNPMPGSAWSVDTSGNWSEALNWTIGVPNAAGAEVAFGNIITDPRAVTVDVPVTVGRINFDSVNAYTIAGPNAVTLDATNDDAEISVTTGNHIIRAPLTLADNTLISVTPANSNLSIAGALGANGMSLTKAGAGRLTVNNVRAMTLTIDGGTVSIIPNGTNAGTSAVSALVIAGVTNKWTTTLDLNNNDAVVRSTAATKAADFARLYNQLKQGFANGTWTGQGITSSTAAENVADDTGLSLVDNALLGATEFSGQTVNNDSLLLKYTYYGDIDMNGRVDGEDLTVFANNFGQTTGMTQVDGDIDFNGTVDGEDLSAFANNLGKGIGNPLAAGAVAAVPEPASLVLAGLAALIALAGMNIQRWRVSRAGVLTDTKEPKHSVRGLRSGRQQCH